MNKLKTRASITPKEKIAEVVLVLCIAAVVSICFVMSKPAKAEEPMLRGTHVTTAETTISQCHI